MAAVAPYTLSPYFASPYFNRPVISAPVAPVRACVKIADRVLFSVTCGDRSGCGQGCSSTMFNYHNLDNYVRLYTEEPFKNAVTGVALDPDVVNVTIKQPDGTIETFTYSDSEESVIIRDDVGEYHLDVLANQSGNWFYRWHSTGNGKAVAERRFVVRPSIMGIG